MTPALLVIYALAQLTFTSYHHYDYVSDGWDPAVYHHTRFGSEYGFQSLPSVRTLKAVAEPADLALSSEFSNSRQHHPGGNQEMLLEIKRHFSVPLDPNGTDFYPEFVYFSQINQAMSTKTETEFLRRSRSLLTPAGEGQTMGALYWQLNDVWQAPSWSSIDIAGRWKMLHYFARDFFAPVLVSPTLSLTGEVAADIVSDVLEFKDRLNLVISVLGWDSFEPRHVDVVPFQLAGPGTTRVWSSNLRQVLESGKCSSSRQCFLLFEIKTAKDSKPIGPTNFILPAPLKTSNLHTATLRVTHVSGPLPGSQHQRHDFLVRVTSTAPAAFAWLEAGDLTGRFSSNGMLLVKPELELRFHTDEEITAQKLLKAITVVAVNSERYSDPSTDSPQDGGQGNGADVKTVVTSMIVALALFLCGEFQFRVA